MPQTRRRIAVVVGERAGVDAGAAGYKLRR
jgi:hypothetical protein